MKNMLKNYETIQIRKLYVYIASQGRRWRRKVACKNTTYVSLAAGDVRKAGVDEGIGAGGKMFSGHGHVGVLADADDVGRGGQADAFAGKDHGGRTLQLADERVVLLERLHHSTRYSTRNTPKNSARYSTRHTAAVSRRNNRTLLQLL